MRLGPLVTVVAAAAIAIACGRSSPSSTASPDAAPATLPAPADTIEAALPMPTEPLYYTGVVTLPGASLAFNVTLKPGADGAWSGTMSIPAQALTNGPLHDVSVSGDRVAFVLRPPGAPEVGWARFKARRTPAGGIGHLKQNGQQFAMTLKAVTAEALADAGPRRPQTPKPPFPYVTRDVIIPHAAAKGVIAGTLTAPEAPGPHPAALLITGSGAQDRDETIFDHKPFLVLADHLTRAGFAVLRVDDRGVGGSTANPDATVQDHASDVDTAFAFLVKQPEVDPKRAGLIGHSEGGVIAPLVAAKRDDVAFIVSLAGAIVPGYELMPLQAAALSRANGLSDASATMLAGHNRALMQAIRDGKDADAIAAVIRASIDEARAAGIPGMPAPGADTDAFIKGQAAASTSRWFRSFVTLDPRPHWSKVAAPVLALNGTLDQQVPYAENLVALRDALDAGIGDPKRHTLRKLDGLNHLFQTAKTGSVAEYAQIEETVAPAALEAVSAWLSETMGVKGSDDE